jgi:hypothetical protein
MHDVIRGRNAGLCAAITARERGALLLPFVVPFPKSLEE